MPYKDPEKQREFRAQWYRDRYAADRKFRHAESDRKAAWLQTDAGKESNLEATKRALKKAERKARAATKKRPS